ncbi:MAG: hypothetical protein LH465_03340 [Sphingomonas bacterium]|nr:hypothetical protein [Sphingomonas bacterium]
MAEDQLDAAYPLVRTIAPEVSLEQWIDYVREVRRKGGLLGVTVDGGALFGLLTYRKETTLRRGCVLYIDNIVTFELNRAAPGRRALCEAAEGLALKMGCSALEYRLGSRGYADGESAKAQGWVSLGHRLEGVIFTKPLDTERRSMSGERLVLPASDSHFELRRSLHNTSV